MLTGCGKSKSNCFSAREKCKHNKGDLATMDSVRDIGANIKMLAESNFFTYCNKFYIGLVQESWIIVNQDGGKSKVVSLFAILYNTNVKRNKT